MAVRPWKWKERSTRNCIHAQVYIADGEERVRCGLGKRLSSLRTDEHYGISYRTVLRTTGWASRTCEQCGSFARDQKEALTKPYLVAVRLEGKGGWEAVEAQVREALGGSFPDVRILAVREI